MVGNVKRFIDCFIPVTTCNLRCSYCYVAQQGLFKQQVPKFEHTAQEIRAALSVARMGGPCVINLCAGGETLIAPQVLDIVKELLEEGHYVMVVTNGTLSRRFEQLAALPSELLRHLFIKFSFHYLELKRLQAFDSYFANIDKIRRSGISFTVELMPCDEEIQLIPEIKKVCMDHLGALCHVTIARSDIDPDHKIPHLSNLSFHEYLEVWSTFDSPLFDFKASIFYQHRDEFCYAGDWTLYVHLGTGDVTQCYCGKRLGNIFDRIEFEAIGKKCTQAHCYNGHVWLAFGDIPQLKTPTYAQLRNRIDAQGREWLEPEVKDIFSSRLNKRNRRYTFWKKWKIAYSSAKKFEERIAEASKGNPKHTGK